jgi:hypothetical protein
MVYFFYLYERSMFAPATRHDTAYRALNVVDNILGQMNLFAFVTCLAFRQLISVRLKRREMDILTLQM